MRKLVPRVIRTIHGMRPVLRVVAHPPGSHQHSPIKNDFTAVEVVTDAGARWYGVGAARITSGLRMEVSGFDPRFEELNAWEDSDE